MRSETKYLSQKITYQEETENKERISNITNDSQTIGLSDFSDDLKEISNSQEYSNNCKYKKFFQQKIKQTEITPTLHKKAINWLITFCWTRNYNDQVLWYSIGYFYSYMYSKIIKKDHLTLILISSVNLALKLFQNDSVLGLDTMKSLLNNAWSIEDFRNLQEEFVELFEFDLYYPSMLGSILKMDCSQEEKSKILFLSQSLFMNSYESAINDLMLEDVMCLMIQPESDHNLKTEIMKLFKNVKMMQILKQKYASKFNIDKFLNEIIKEK